MKIRSLSRSLVAITALVLVAVACGTDTPVDPGGTADAATSGTDEQAAGDVELSMWLFGEFGYDPLIEEYEQDHPGVTITTKIAEYNEHHTSLTTALAAGSGGPDIAAIDVGFMSQFLGRADNFANLYDHGAAEIEGDYLDWKWKLAETPDGEQVIGLPTDVGGLAMAYRADLFEAAGLPTDRDEVSQLWPTWEEFIAAGERYTDATGKGFTDESSQLFNAVLNQGDTKFYDTDGTLVYADNPQVKEAWDVANAAVEAGIVANIEPFAEGWNAAMSNGDFAVLTAPAWMMGYIQSQAPDTEGKWDIAAVPGGGGNWGGSHLTIPAQSENVEEAYAFISWLLAPEQQLRVFEENGNFPSTPALYEDEAIQGFTDPFFRDAPVGQIYAESASSLEPIYEGPEEGAIRLVFENALDRVEEGGETPEEAWQSAVEEVQRDVG